MRNSLTYWRQNKRGQKRSGSVFWCTKGVCPENQGYEHDLVSKLCPWQSLESCCIDPWAVGERAPWHPFLFLQLPYPLSVLRPHEALQGCSWLLPILPWPQVLLSPIGLACLLHCEAAWQLHTWWHDNFKQCVFFWGYCKRGQSRKFPTFLVENSAMCSQHGWHKAFHPVLCLGCCEGWCCSEEMGLAGRLKSKLL